MYGSLIADAQLTVYTSAPLPPEPTGTPRAISSLGGAGAETNDLRAVKGSTLMLHCEYDAPPPNVTEIFWTLDGRPVRQSPLYTVFPNGSLLLSVPPLLFLPLLFSFLFHISIFSCMRVFGAR